MCRWDECQGVGKHAAGPSYAGTKTQDNISVHITCFWRKLLEYTLPNF